MKHRKLINFVKMNEFIFLLKLIKYVTIRTNKLIINPNITNLLIKLSFGNSPTLTLYISEKIPIVTRAI